ncbi:MULTISPECIES: cytochrome c biogenesis CcdA family protein [Fusobacterium]|uniref:cytochrome c biogenesis CcdA family protein n=1 Tax=Fusobacterium TaxID=848 RepID=UPI001476F70D|nr:MULTISPECIES: cytochrome c biogenesis CcdA family protein [Fusobacterium]NME36175.1 cytochrome c biogenesis protein CcdA [Fusobacterium sp. FSA-380-WT-3A]
MVYLTIFLGGILSFFSPCILPVIPLYIGYLSGNDLENKKKLIVNTVFFTIGISFAFIVLSMGFSTFGVFLQKYRDLISKISGILIIILGLFQMGIFKLSSLEKERRMEIEIKNINPIVAFLFGFTFSFAWTPCIGPALSSILFTITALKDIKQGYILMGFYTLGFTLPFLMTALFSSYFIKIFRKNMHVVNYTTKIMGFLLVILGIIVFMGKLNEIIGYLL